MESHKRILAILFIIAGGLQLFGLLLVSAFFSAIVPFFINEIDHEAQWIVEMVSMFIPFFIWGFIILFSIPSIIGGIALLNEKKWALTLLLVLGCFKLFSFPIGTALGIYTIWVYTEDNKINVTNDQTKR